MLRLAIHEPGVESFRESDSTRVRTWHDVFGVVCAHSYVNQTGNWLRWPGLVSFHCTENGTIEAFPDKPVAESVLRDLWRRTAEPLLLQALGWETLHASAVLTASGAFAFCGERQAGKSTLAYALSRRGYPQYADDTVVLQVESREIRALDRPFGVRLRSEPAAFFGFQPDRHHFQDVVPIPPGSERASTTPLAAICVLRQAPIAATAMNRMPPAAAMDAVVRNAHCFNPDEQGRKRLLKNYLRVTATVPVYELLFSTGLEHLGSVLECVEAAMNHTQMEPV